VIVPREHIVARAVDRTRDRYRYYRLGIRRDGCIMYVCVRRDEMPDAGYATDDRWITFHVYGPGSRAVVAQSLFEKMRKSGLIAQQPERIQNAVDALVMLERLP